MPAWDLGQAVMDAYEMKKAEIDRIRQKYGDEIAEKRGKELFNYDDNMTTSEGEFERIRAERGEVEAVRFMRRMDYIKGETRHCT